MSLTIEVPLKLTLYQLGIEMPPGTRFGKREV